MMEMFVPEDPQINRDLSDNYFDSVHRYGHEYILRQCAEECMELGQALLKDIRQKNHEAVRSYADGVLDEIADVLITITNVKQALGYSDDMIEDAIREKVDRTRSVLIEQVRDEDPL